MNKFLKILPFLFLFGCAGQQRGCASGIAQTFGGDWVVAQYRADGTPFNCWALKNTSIANEEHSDGVYWLDSSNGHLVHLSGWYNRVQVSGNDYASAAKLVGVEYSLCKNGRYVTEQ